MPLRFTVAGNAPTSWFRVAPDLDIAFHSPADFSSPSMFCWRTPTSSACVPDTSPALTIASTSGGETLVIAPGGGGGDVQIQLDDGSGRSAPIVTSQSVVDIGVARFELPDGVSIVSSQIAVAGSSLSGDPDPVVVTGATLPPSGDLIEVPMTVMAGSPLPYWRFFTDLDIAQRQPADSETELCWRTPAGTGFVDDAFYSPDVGIIPTDGAAILLARPALIPIEPPPSDPMAPTLQVGPHPRSSTSSSPMGSHDSSRSRRANGSASATPASTSRRAPRSRQRSRAD